MQENNNLEKNEQKPIITKRKMYRKISKPDIKLQTPKNINKIEVNIENEKPHVKNTNLNNIYNHEPLKIFINNDNSKNATNTFKNENFIFFNTFNNNKAEVTPRNNKDKNPIIKKVLWKILIILTKKIKKVAKKI